MISGQTLRLVCLILLSYQPDSETPLLIAANRDEFYRRRAAQLDWWPGLDVLAGRDLGYASPLLRLTNYLRLSESPNLGTWLGVNRAGKFAAITNYREPGKENKNARSRGLLVSSFLESRMPAEVYAVELQRSAGEYNGFNLLFGDTNAVYYFGNRGDGAAIKLSPGTYALSNALLDTPWYKVTKIKSEFSRLRHPITPGQLFPIFADDTPAPEGEVQQTGLAPAIEKGLSSPFIRLPGYGTRVTSVLEFRQNGEIEFCERTFRRGQPRGDQKFVFKVQN